MTVCVIAGEPAGTVPVAIPVREGALPDLARMAAASDGFSGAENTVCDLLGDTPRTLLVGIGDGADPACWEAAGATAAATLAACPHIAIDARSLAPSEAAALAAGACLRAWHAPQIRKTEDEDAPKLQALDLLVSPADARAVSEEWAKLQAGIAGALFARDLVTAPANILTPPEFARRLQALTETGLDVEILGADRLAQEGYNCLLAVGAGSQHPPCLAILRWPGSANQKPVAFVGKGITFDTGGICIKPADHMWDMRADMAGAAACAGAMLALALRKSPAHAIAILAIAENATGANSYRPGDVLLSRAGRTIHIVDTDAEGRLVLADALTCALVQTPAAIIDLATLTGSIVTALGHHHAGLFANDDTLATALMAAGNATHEKLWRMPIAEEHRRALDSDIADIKHCVDARMQPDASQAAAFLKEFVAETPWAHLDIAGVEAQASATSRCPKGATGFGARLLDHLVATHFESQAA